MSTQFACPSPRGTNGAGLYLTRAGHLVDKHGNHWGRSSMRLAQDAALATPESSGLPKTKRSTAEWAQSHARAALYEALGEACREHELSDDQHKELREHIDRRLKGEDDENKGMGALDDTDADEDDKIDAKVREFLRAKGLDDESVETAIKKARADREAARDSRPQPATRGGMGGRFSGATKDDVEAEYGGGHLLDLPNYSPDPDRFGSGYDPLKGRDPARNLPGGGTSRRLSNDAGLAADEDIEQQIEREYGGAHIKAGMFGR